MSCVVGLRRSSDMALLWLWHRPAGTAPIQPLAWEPPDAASAVLKKKKEKKKTCILKTHLLVFFFHIQNINSSLKVNNLISLITWKIRKSLVIPSQK